MKIIASLVAQIVALVMFMVGGAFASASTGDIAGAPGWHIGYTGYGSVTAHNRTLTLRPKVSTAPSETHAALALSDATYGDFSATVKVRTNSQLRKPSPNSWEVGWLLWHYTNDSHFYYIALKPNGIELGKEDPAYPGSQRYLVTASAPRFRIGRWYTIKVTQRDDAIAVSVDGKALLHFTDTQRPYRTGHLGLYCEDSSVSYRV